MFNNELYSLKSLEYDIIQLFKPLLCSNKRKQCLLGAGSECVCSCVYFNRFPVTACNRARAHHVELVVDVGEAVLDDEVLHADSAVGGRVPGHDVGHVGHTLHAFPFSSPTHCWTDLIQTSCLCLCVAMYIVCVPVCVCVCVHVCGCAWNACLWCVRMHACGCVCVCVCVACISHSSPL